jgi:PAS domain S-box-containing protein
LHRAGPGHVSHRVIDMSTRRAYGQPSGNAAKQCFAPLQRKCLTSLPIYLGRALLVALFIVSPSFSASPPNAKNILILHSTYHPLSEYLKTQLRTKISNPVNIYFGDVEENRLSDPEYSNGVLQTLKHVHGNDKLDLVLVEQYPALQFALEHRDELFPHVPIVFFDIEGDWLTGQTLPSDVTGVTSPLNIPATINLALRLHPDTKVVAVIIGDSTLDKHFLSDIHSELLRHQNAITETDLVALPPATIMDRIASLPSKSLVLFQFSQPGSAQPMIGANELVAWVGNRFPTYCIFPMYCLNNGGIGGVGFDGFQQLTIASDLAKRVLSGEPPESIPIVRPSGNQVKVNWRQLRRWNIPESALPPNTLFFNREPTFWQREWKYIIATVVQTLLIVGLLWQRVRKRKAEAVLRESEERFRVMADTTPSLIWMCNPKGQITYLNDRSIAFTGPDPKAGYGDSWIRYVHPDDLDDVMDTLSSALNTRQPFSHEYRLRRSDGVYRWMFDVASPRVNGDGTFAGFIGSAIDTTENKLAQQALEKVSGQLIEAQEKERSRIARELHDDICQRLALLSMELAAADRASKGSTATNLEEIRKHCAEIAGDVQSLSHQLHSSKLEYLGLASAIRGFCKEFEKQHRVSIAFTDSNVPKPLPKDVSLCLFRVTQEALQNAVKYSDSREYWVNLTGTENNIQLTVQDRGSGFDLEQAKKERGLGLVSMHERVNLVHGNLSIESERGMGTKVFAVVPFTPQIANPIQDATHTTSHEVRQVV